jgi:hypothetical protein
MVFFVLVNEKRFVSPRLASRFFNWLGFDCAQPSLKLRLRSALPKIATALTLPKIATALSPP